jgi:hypothetical protein
MDSSLELLEVDGCFNALYIFPAAVFPYEKDGHARHNGLDDLHRVLCRKTKGFRINDDEIILFEHNHLDSKGGVFYGFHVISFVSQNAVEVFDQYGIGGAENNFFHDEGISAFAMPGQKAGG